MNLLLIDLERGNLVRYVDGHRIESYRVTDSQEFDRRFTPREAERLRTGSYFAKALAKNF